MLVSKAAGDVTVRGIFDAVGATNAYSQDEKLCAAGLPIKIETFGGKVHHKFAVIDVHGVDPRVITGSYNWTSAGAETNDENTLIIHDAATAQAYYQEYLRLYQAIPRMRCAAGQRRVGYAGVPGRDRQRLRQPDRRRRRQLPGNRRRRCVGMAWTTTVTARWIRPIWTATAAGGDGGHQRGCDRGGGGQPLALTLQLDPAEGPLTYAWSDQGVTTGTANVRLGSRRASTR